MKRKATKIAGTAASALVLLMAGAFFYRSHDRGAAESKPPEAGPQVVDREDNGTPGGVDQAAEYREVLAPPADTLESWDRPASDDWAAFAAWAAEDLRRQFGGSIANRGIQASLMELRQFLKENHPQDWETKLHDLLHEAFPELADQVLDTFSKMDVYDEWLEENKPNLATMRAQEIEEALWQRRREIFGEEATDIWASRSGTEHLRDMVDILEEAYHVPIEDKLQVFKSAIDRLRPDAAGALVSDGRHIMLSAFLDMESVQDELRQMSPEERAEGLRHIRRSMGLAEQDIERMQKLDAEREERWQRGLRYMAERDELTQDYEGARLEEELRFLRERYFGNQARSIEAEEASGFFRYERRRVYGRN